MNQTIFNSYFASAVLCLGISTGNFLWAALDWFNFTWRQAFSQSVLITIFIFLITSISKIFIHFKKSPQDS